MHRGRLAPGIVGLSALILLGGFIWGMEAAGQVSAAEPASWAGDGDGAIAVATEGFSDIAEAGGHRLNVETLAELGILDGTECDPQKFCPNEPIQRWVMAVWLVRAVDEADPSGRETTRFVDVDAGEWWMPFVERLADLGITKGCALEPARFCPTEPVTREQMASFLVRAFGLAPQAGNKFADVGPGNGQLGDINSLAAAGITAGCALEPARFCPGQDTTRAEMATFLARALGIARKPPPPPEPVLTGDFITVAAGGSHTCAVRASGEVVCWGQNHRGQADPPDGEFTAIAGGVEHSCAVRSDGTITCWGANSYGQTNSPRGRFTSVAAGWAHSCGLRTDGAVLCWGSNWNGETNPPAGQFNAIASSNQHSCGIKTDGAVLCWGSNDSGQTDAPADRFISIAAGSQHSCGVRTNGSVTCWGTGGATASPTTRFVTVTAGTFHSCGRQADLTVTCWGDNSQGQAHPPKGAFLSVSAGELHTCGLRSNQTVTCWGHYEGLHPEPPGQPALSIAAGPRAGCAILTDNTLACWALTESGVANPPVGQYLAVAAGASHFCATRSDHTIGCWGGNWAGQAKPPAGTFDAVAAGGWHSCALKADQTAVCWGGNENGQADPPADGFTALAAGEVHSCGIRTDATVVCWGSNYVDQRDSPQGTFISISAGDNHSCGIRTDQTVACWGYNGANQADPPQGAFTAVSAGREHSCGIRTDGTITCWGLGQDGRNNLPEGRFKAVSAGELSSCGLRTDGTVICWDRVRSLPAPEEADGFIPSDVVADPKACRPQGLTDDTTAGFPLPHWAVRAIGPIRVAVLFVDFSDAPATHSTRQEADSNLSWMKDYLEKTSYGKLKIEFTPFHRWLRAENNSDHYRHNGVFGPAVVREAVRLADPEFDFTGHDVLMTVLPSTRFTGGTALGTAQTEEGTLSTFRINAIGIGDVGVPSWGLVASHELVHNMGLLDLYPYDTTHSHNPPDPPPGKRWIGAEIGLMEVEISFLAARNDPILKDAYFVLAEEMFAWSRWQLGWLEANQIYCLTDPKPEATITLNPVANPRNGLAMVAIPVSQTDVIVIESRRTIGYDTGRRVTYYDGSHIDFSPLAREGILVYTVDTTLGSGQLPIKFVGDPGTGYLNRHPILTEGESITVHGYTITVQSTTRHTDTITITGAK